ncbi:hypothetical protein PQ610_06275 [Tardisphaera miroshnichenkoae]
MESKELLEQVSHTLHWARVTGFLVFFAWAVGFSYFLGVFVTGLFITPWMLGDVVTLYGLTYFAVFAVFVVPAYLVYRHLGSLKYALKTKNYKLLKQLDGEGWAYLEVTLTGIVPAVVLLVVHVPIAVVNGLLGRPLPEVVAKAMEPFMLVVGSALSFVEAYLIIKLHGQAEALNLQ